MMLRDLGGSLNVLTPASAVAGNSRRYFRAERGDMMLDDVGCVGSVGTSS